MMQLISLTVLLKFMSKPISFYFAFYQFLKSDAVLFKNKYIKRKLENKIFIKYMIIADHCRRYVKSLERLSM